MALRRPPTGVAVPVQLRDWLNREVAANGEKSSVVEHTFGGVADTVESVRHRLGRVPSGWRVISQDKAGTIYSGGASTRFTIPLRASVASVTVRLEVF